MNYALMVSTKVEEKLGGVVRDASWAHEDEMKEYNRCLKEVLAELDTDPWVSGDIRIGDYILLGMSIVGDRYNSY